ncbi:hypothetical protein [Agromyces rhizosphaerae]|uniref:hypothetical protein n=1 Tax=Agromyces rhizosphaerae TaxID=88374 RepID=UPI0040395D91
MLLLDEPTAGLDPLMEAEFQACIREATTAGQTVLLSSHILAQVEVLADRISIIREGRNVETGSLAELRHLTRTSVSVAATGDTASLESLPGVHHFRVDDGFVRFDVDGEAMPALVARLGALEVTGLTATPPTLEQLLLRHYGDVPEGAAGADAPESTEGAGATDAPGSTGSASAPAATDAETSR